MGQRDPRIDAYVERSAEFARPILSHFRELVHAALPDAVETLKWGVPHFTHRGIVCGMAAFKQHCAIMFPAGVVPDEGGKERRGAMGQFGRLTSVRDLPPKRALTRLVRESARRNETRQPTRRSATKVKVPRMPADFARALRADAAAKATYDGFPPGARRDYLEWILEAKREATRARRIETSVTWLAEGKKRNWKYET